MNSKSFIVTLYGIALFIVLSRYYKAGGKGLPKPSLITGPSYLYGVLAITSDFLEGLPIVLAAGLTFGLYIAVHPTPAKPHDNPNQYQKAPPGGWPINPQTAQPIPGKKVGK